MAEKLNKKGQVSIWIILGVILIASISLFFAIDRKADLNKPADSDSAFDMQSFLDECTTRAVNDVVDIMLPQGGFVQPRNYVLFNRTEVEYLCYNSGFFNQEPLGTCVQQHMLKNEMKKEIKNYLDDERTEKCFQDMQKEFGKRGGEMGFDSSSKPVVEIGWGPDKIIINIEKKTTITKQGEKRRFDNFIIEIKSPAYNLADVADTIGAYQQSAACNAEYVGYGLTYPRYDIDTYAMSDSTEIYMIKDIKSGKIMNIAIRACATKRGLG